MNGRKRPRLFIYFVILFIIVFIGMLISSIIKNNKNNLNMESWDTTNTASNFNDTGSTMQSTMQPETQAITQTISQDIPESVIETTNPIKEASVEQTKKFEETDQRVIETTSILQQDFVANLNIVQSISQLIVVAANGTSATVTMHQKDSEGIWSEILSTSGFVGSHGVGKASEQDSKTPRGVFSLSFAFGIKDNPGTALNYTKVDDSYYWVDDSTSKFYNQFLSLNNVIQDWSSAEHITQYQKQYAYVIPIDYNMNCTPNEGSAIFLHCSNGSPTGGCVSVPEKDMVFILNHISSGCKILIDDSGNITQY